MIRTETINLPKIIFIEVKNWKLMTSDFQFKMGLKGVYAIIGGNTQGKTTIVNAIVCGLIGKSALPDGNVNYFKERLEVSKEKPPIIQLTYLLGKFQLNIVRNLVDQSIIEFSLKEEDSIPITERPKSYQKLVVQHSHLATFEQFELLVLNFLYFPEKANNLHWNYEIQDRILRFLFQNPQFDKNLEIKRDEKLKLESKIRNMRYQLSKIKGSVSDLKNAIEDINIEISNDINENELPDLLTKRAKLIIQETDLRKEFSKKEKLIESIALDVRRKSRKLLDLEKRIANTEEKSFAQIFRKIPPLTTYIIDQSSKDICIGCGETRDGFGEKVLKLTKDGKCIVCKEELLEFRETTSEEEFSQLENLQEEYKREVLTLNPSQMKLRKLKTEKDDTNKKIQKLRDEISEITIKVEGIRIEGLKKHKGKMDIESIASNFTAISQLNKQINKSENEINDLVEQRNELNSEIQNLLEKDKKDKKNLLTEFMEFYRQVGSDFLGRKVKLEWYSIPKSKSKAKRAHQVLIPSFSEKNRSTSEEVSETEGIILDIAFRVAITEFWTKKTENNATLILETPDNSLDPSYVSRIAQMFIKYTNTGNSLLITSNLVNPQVLKEVFEAQDPNAYILNLLDYGKKTKVQQDEYDKLERVINQIYGKN